MYLLYLGIPDVSTADAGFIVGSTRAVWSSDYEQTLYHRFSQPRFTEDG